MHDDLLHNLYIVLKEVVMSKCKEIRVYFNTIYHAVIHFHKIMRLMPFLSMYAVNTHKHIQTQSNECKVSMHEFNMSGP